MFEEQR